MKTVGTFFGALLFSLYAFTTNYAGNGEWKSCDGQSGTYSVQASIELGSDQNVSVSQTLHVNDQTLQIKVLLQKIDDTFYNVLNAATGEKVGKGYCWKLDEEGEKVCHSASHVNGNLVESTIKVTKDALYRIGSKTNLETKKKTIWKDKLLPQANG